MADISFQLILLMIVDVQVMKSIKMVEVMLHNREGLHALRERTLIRSEVDRKVIAIFAEVLIGESIDTVDYRLPNPIRH